MDITPIYELRGRLRAAMIAGTNLLAEDFRLKRAVEAFAPLEKAAPVFAKIGEMSRSLLEPEQRDKEGALLDAITLVDAVCCTQGAVAAAGETEPIPAGGIGTVVSNAPYSVLKNLQEALTSSGSGHFSHVTETHKNHPELFSDYRVKAAMIRALNASYAELADQVCEWLKEEGEELLPFLMRGFDPKGKKEMVRRVHVIEAVAGAGANDFYCNELSEAEGEVRQALLYALRHSEENAGLLLELRQKERGNAKKIVYSALACMENDEAAGLFRDMYAKKPADVMGFLHFSDTSWASELTARCIREQLPVLAEAGKKGKEAEKECLDLFTAAAKALPWKKGSEACGAFRMLAEAEESIDSRLKKSVCPSSLLCSALILHPEKELLSLALSLYEGEENKGGRKNYFSAAFLARLLISEENADCRSGGNRRSGTGSGDAVSDWLDWLDALLYRKSLIGEKRNLSLHPPLVEALEHLHFDSDTGSYLLRVSSYNEFDGQQHFCKRPLKQDITGRFTDILMRCSNAAVDGTLMRLINPADEAYCRKLEEYFYKRALTAAGNRRYLAALNRCGGTRCEGLLVHYVREMGRLALWEIRYYIEQMPGSREEKRKEALQVMDLVRSGQIKVQNWTDAEFMGMLDKVC